MVEWVVYYDRDTGREIERELTGGMIQGDIEMNTLMISERLGLSEDEIGYRLERDDSLDRLRTFLVFFEQTTGRELFAEEVTEDLTANRISDLWSLVAYDNDLRHDYVGKRFELR